MVAQTVKNLPAMWGLRFNLWRRKWQSTPVLLSGEFHRQRSLVGYSPWSHKESDMIENTYICAHVRACVHMHTHTQR